MKNLAYVLLFCYALALFRPVVPAVADGLAHAFWEMEHMATVHGKNGRFHVHKEVKEAGDEDPSKTNKRAAADEVTASHLNPQEKTNLSNENPPARSWTIAAEKIPSSISLQIPTPPPWQA